MKQLYKTRKTGKVSVPNLVLLDALRFCKTFDDYCWEDENELDFSQVKTCREYGGVSLAIISLHLKHRTFTSMNGDLYICIVGGQL